MHHKAVTAAERIVNAGVRRHNDQAEREEQTATTLEGYISGRDRDQRTAIQANEANAPRRDALISAAEVDRARIARHRQIRDRDVETMTPEQITAADQARTDHVTEQARQHVGVVQQGPQQPTRPRPLDWEDPTHQPTWEPPDRDHGIEM